MQAIPRVSYPCRQPVTPPQDRLLILVQQTRRSGRPDPRQSLVQEDCYRANLGPLKRRTRKQQNHILNRILTPAHLRGRSRQVTGTHKAVRSWVVDGTNSRARIKDCWIDTIGTASSKNTSRTIRFFIETMHFLNRMAKVLNLYHSIRICINFDSNAGRGRRACHHRAG